MSDPAGRAARLKDQGERISQLLRLRTLPIGLKLLQDPETLGSVPKLRRPGGGARFALCQLVGQCRYGGATLGVTADDLLAEGGCASVPGLAPLGEEFASGRRMAGVWFEGVDAAAAHQAQMPRVPPGRFRALILSPLRSERVQDPDVVLFFATPAQAILFVNGLQRRQYRRLAFTIGGESACADSWGRALLTRETSVAIPCYAERRFGGVAEDELLVAAPPADLAAAIEGLEGLAAVGLRYPIAPYGIGRDPADGMATSYGKKG